MSFGFSNNDYKNIFSNEHLNKKIASPQRNSINQVKNPKINYHYLQKERQKKEKENLNQFNNINNKNSLPNNYIYNREKENNKIQKELDSYKRENHHNKYEYQRNFQRLNYPNKTSEIKINSNLIPENEKSQSQKSKLLMDNFDKKLFDTITNFSNKNKEEKNETTLNSKRNYSYDKYREINNNNIQKSTLHNTDSLYKNYFQNNLINNMPKINHNDSSLYNNNKNYFKYNNNNDGYRPRNIINNNIYDKETENNKFKSKINYTIKNYSSYSLGGTDAFRHNKTNQDSFLTKEDENNYIFGVFDGHGLEGHLISQSIKTYLYNNANSDSFSSSNKIFSFFKDLSTSINSSKSFNSMESGSTAVITFINKDKIICANCGDSRAILISENDNKIIPLSRDHKPDLQDEKKRIINSGGRVDKICGMGPYRVWFKDAEYPGLAMSRSIGDGYAHKIGVIDEPEIFEFNLDNVKPKAIVLASDGVFEFVKNEEIKDIVGKYFYNMDSQGCAKEIVEYCRKVWEGYGYAIDDITCIVAFF